MKKETLIDIRNICEPALSMKLLKATNEAEYNECIHFIANDTFVYRQVKILCKKQGHNWRVFESNKKNHYFQIRIGKPTLKQQSFKQNFLQAALTF